MKVSKEPVSAFAIYSEKLKQKKKSNPLSTNRSNTLSKKRVKTNVLKFRQMKEIENIILKKLAEKSNTPNIDASKTITGAHNSKQNKKKMANVNDHSHTGIKAKTRLSDIFSHHKQDVTGIKVIKNPETKSRTAIGDSVENLNNSVTLVENPAERTNMKNSLPKASDIFVNKNSQRTLNNLKSKKKKQLLTTQKKIKNIFNSNNKSVQCKTEIIDKATASHSSIEGENSSLVTSTGNVLSKPNRRGSKVKLKKKKSEGAQIKFLDNQENSYVAAKKLFEWLILPISQKDFMRDYWEKQPLLIQREKNRNYFSELLSTTAIDGMLRENVIFFTKHLDVTSYTNGVRETHNLSGRAQANVVWDFYSNGCSIRLLNPQAFLPKIHTLNATLQEYFGCFIGANVYLTPPNSQGFAPHFDDIEAFVLQIEGKKHWKVYPPRNDKETLPRFSSPNFTQEEIGKPFLDVTLEPGDILYFPRGFIHQASTVEGEHSLHITLSAYQKTAWVDLLEKTLPLALKRAAEEDVEFRRGLPRDYLGLEYHGSDTRKISFMNTAQRLMSKLGEFLKLSLGAGVDQMGAEFMHNALPPVFTNEEKKNSGIGGGLKMKENGKLEGRVELEYSTCVKLIRANVCRLVEEEGEVRLYHCLDNPLEYHAEEPQFLVLPIEGIPVITFLASKYPSFVEVRSIPHDDKESLITLLSDLWDSGLLLTR